MKKLYRSTLVVGVLAFGVAACGDDVQIVDPEPTPPPALSVTLTPQQLALTVGESGNLTVGIVGGDPAAQSQVTCESSNAGVATATASGDVCAVTAVSAGTATVTARVTKGNQTSSAGAAITVTAVPEPEPEPEPEDPEPATVSISQVLTGGSQVDLDNASGQLDVVINLQRNEETVQAVALFADDIEVARQTFSRAELDEIAAAIAEDAEIAEAVEQITLSFRSNAYEIVDGEAVIRTPNGNYGLSAAAIVMVEGEEVARASDDLPITFRNADGFHVQAAFPADGNTAVDADGRRWYGNWGEDAMDLVAIPVFFSGQGAQNVRVAVCGQAETEEAGPFAFEFSCANFEGTGVLPTITAQYAVSGDDAPGTILNLESADHPFPARVDNRAPTWTPGAFVITRASGLFNTGNWVNDQYPFRAGFRNAQVTDGGVGRPAQVADGVGFAVSDGPTTGSAIFITEDYNALMGAAGLDETVTNRELWAWAVVSDRLGNTAFIRQAAEVDDDHPLGTFGYDVTAPDFAFFEEDDALGAIEGPYNFINQFTTDDGIGLQATDNLAGFNPEFAAEHALITIRGALNGDGAIETAGLVTAATPGIVGAPFAAARDGNRIANLAAIDEGLVEYIDQTALQVDFTLAAALGDAFENRARYYLYQVQLRDQAGNISRGYRAVYLNNNSEPVIENLTNPSVFDGNAAFQASLVRDSVEVLEGALEIRYPNTRGTLVWERPGSDLTSVLRMNAGILDGELFSDVIYRPQRDVQFPTGFAALGLDFIRNVQTLDPADLATAKPDSARARVFNGYAAQDSTLNFSSAIPDFGGISQIVARNIDADELAAPSFYFVNRSTTAPAADAEADWTFVIVDETAANCPADTYCVRAIGPRSDFTNPFAGGPVAIVWADDYRTGSNGELQWRVMKLAEANFNHPFPTRDSGDNRIYEWTFKIPSDVNPRELVGELAIAAIGIRPDGNALLGTFAEDDDPPPPPPPFEISMADATGFVPGTDQTATFRHPVTVTSGGPIGEWECAVEGDGLSAETYTDEGEDGCAVTVTDEASSGFYTVSVKASEEGTEQVAEDSATLTLGALTVDPELLMLKLGETETGDFVVSFELPIASAQIGAAENGMVGIESIVCDVDETLPEGITTTAVDVQADGGICRVTVAEDGPAGGPFNMGIQVEIAGQTTILDVAVVVEPADEMVGPWAPVVYFDDQINLANNQGEGAQGTEVEFEVRGIGKGIETAEIVDIIRRGAGAVNREHWSVRLGEQNVAAGTAELFIEIDPNSQPSGHKLEVELTEKDTGTSTIVTVYVKVQN